MTGRAGRKRQAAVARRAARPLLHATDFSAASRPAFRAALALAKADRAPLVLAHVVAPLTQVPEIHVVSPPTYARFLDAVEADARRRLDRLAVQARSAGVRTSTLLLRGAPHEAVVQAARRHRAGLLVIGTHGRTGLPRAVLGSVAARIVALAPCPVLTVRGVRGAT